MTGFYDEVEDVDIPPEDIRASDDCACHRCPDRRVCVLGITETADGRRLVHCSCPSCGDGWHFWLPEKGTA